MNRECVLIPYSIEALQKMPKHKGPTNGPRNIIDILEEFVNKNHDCCVVSRCDSNELAHMDCTAFNRVIKRENYINVKIVRRGSTVFLVKKDAWEKCCKNKSRDINIPFYENY